MKFIQNSINKQQEAVTKKEALKMFSLSCNICCTRGIQIQCEQCPIKAAHELTMSVLDDIEKEVKINN